jgi:hypothetical protein
VTTGVTEHDRDVTLNLRRHLVAKGKVTSDLDGCTDGVTVKVQRKKNGRWRTVANVATNDAGHYAADIGDREGRYRALAPAVDAGPNDACLSARSPKERHDH